MNSIEQGKKALLPQEDDELELKRQKNTTAILRVFNYYRVFLSFALLLLFIQVPDQTFVGRKFPDLFQAVILGYIGINIVVSFAALIVKQEIVARRSVVFGVMAVDVILLCMLMFASGGISSGLGNFLIFPVAFAGVLTFGRLSVVVAAIAVILGFYSEVNLMMRAGGLDPELIFKVGVLGIALFAVNILFQYLAVQLRRKEAEVTTLERLEEMRRIAEETKSKLDDSNARLDVLLNSAGEGILGLDLQATITFANPKAAELLRMPIEELTGRCIRQYAFPNDPADIESTKFQMSNLLHQLDVNARSTIESHDWRRNDGESFVADYTCEAMLDQHGQPTGAVVIFQDATERKEVEEQMNYLANYDSLTNLVNRGFFQTTLEQAVSRSQRSNANLAVLLLDLDHFKCINDQYGHDYGDELLREVSDRIQRCIRTGDTAARLGGDEFALMLLDFNSPDNVSLVARNLVEEVSRPYHVKDRVLRVSTSIGIATFNADTRTANELLKKADIAMYSSKTGGRNTWRFFSPEMQQEAESVQRIQMALQDAVEQNEFKMHYQPIVSLNDGMMHHSEALIRWVPRGEDPISPDIFIPIAEETGKINEIGNWVIQRVLEQMETWNAHHGQCPSISVNVSPKQLLTSHFRSTIERYLEQYAIPAEALELELTETGVMNDPETVLSELVALHELGVRISVDDFGTGYSSLAYLRKLPIDQVKIDKCFIQSIGKSAHDEEIIRTIIAIARAMHLTVVGEGVETQEQLEFLRDNGCDFGQGHLFSRPLDILGMSEVITEDLAVRGERGETERRVDNVTRIDTRRVPA